MADTQFSAAPDPSRPAPPDLAASPQASHPMANPGYGKRSTPDQPPRGSADFAHLPRREAAVAAFIDRLRDGSDMSVKTLAKALPYGQCALRTALRTLQATGHLRRGREHLFTEDGARWVTRTWFSRTARTNAWWSAFISGDVPPDDGASARRQTRSRAYILLAALGRTAPALSLSAADCTALEPLTATWFERGATERQVLRALTNGLPSVIHHPAAFTRKRLEEKLPPEPVIAPRPALRILECATCCAPGRPETLLDGECGPCRGEPAPVRGPSPVPPDRVRALAAEARAAASRPPERTPV
ncbi:hypothetical protein [Streptomyces sp. NPDC051569]|uniref:hypothetical protein n=1 Tax=Streptomyces sp. NPDC051569 TaxID=3365661 RepID=UPI0037BB761A